MKRSLLLYACLVITAAGTAAGQRQQMRHIEKRFTAETDRPLELILDVDAGEVHITRGSTDRDVVIDISYTEDTFRERLDFDTNRNRVTVELDTKSWKRIGKDHDDDTWSRVTLEIPDGVDVLFDSRLKAGEVDMDLGGIRLREFTLSMWAGETDIRFSEPNPVIMDMLDINAKVGECTLSDLGNTRFRTAEINGGIGELSVDFNGALLPGSRADVDLDIGEASVYVPDAAGVKLMIGGMFSFMSSKRIDSGFRKRGRAYYNDRFTSEEQGFQLRITPGLGELSVTLDE
ncbi:hypothetical protein JXO52_01185 [bacterium]|nr:hypothetical protein [bacterium]